METQAPAFARIHRNRDIVLVDQRADGEVQSLNCDIDDVELMSATADQLAGETKRCRQELSKRADLAYYTTSVAVKDLDAVRAALGYTQINLYGGSYGTRVAEHYLRRYPEHTRAVILDGVIAPEEVLGPNTAIDAENALQSVFKRCLETAECKTRFGDPAETYRARYARRSMLVRFTWSSLTQRPASHASWTSGQTTSLSSFDSAPIARSRRRFCLDTRPREGGQLHAARGAVPHDGETARRCHRLVECTTRSCARKMCRSTSSEKIDRQKIAGDVHG